MSSVAVRFSLPETSALTRMHAIMKKYAIHFIICFASWSIQGVRADVPVGLVCHRGVSCLAYFFSTGIWFVPGDSTFHRKQQGPGEASMELAHEDARVLRS